MLKTPFACFVSFWQLVGFGVASGALLSTL
jgi:hypothetical protein